MSRQKGQLSAMPQKNERIVVVWGSVIIVARVRKSGRRIWWARKRTAETRGIHDRGRYLCGSVRRNCEGVEWARVGTEEADALIVASALARE